MITQEDVFINFSPFSHDCVDADIRKDTLQPRDYL